MGNFYNLLINESMKSPFLQEQSRLDTPNHLRWFISDESVLLGQHSRKNKYL